MGISNSKREHIARIFEGYRYRYDITSARIINGRVEGVLGCRSRRNDGTVNARPISVSVPEALMSLATKALVLANFDDILRIARKPSETVCDTEQWY